MKTNTSCENKPNTYEQDNGKLWHQGVQIDWLLIIRSDSLRFYGTGDLQPEKRLIFAVLLDAVECFQKYAGHEADRLFRDMGKWIFENDRELPFSFIIIISVKPWILTRSICGKVYCSGDKERSRNPIIAAERLSSGRIICR